MAETVEAWADWPAWYAFFNLCISTESVRYECVGLQILLTVKESVKMEAIVFE